MVKMSTSTNKLSYFFAEHVWNYLKVGLCAVVDCCYASTDWHLYHIEDIWSATRPCKMVFLRIRISVVRFHDDKVATVQEKY